MTGFPRPINGRTTIQAMATLTTNYSISSLIYSLVRIALFTERFVQLL